MPKVMKNQQKLQIPNYCNEYSITSNNDIL